MAAIENSLILVTGGARSGKSRYALALAKPYASKAFVATGLAIDDEMRARIARHRQERGNVWQTFEEPYDIAGLVREQASQYELLLIDCLTFWLSNLLLKEETESAIRQKIDELASVLESKPMRIIVVTNEVGSGIVPDNVLARRFHDLAGFANQKIAMIADKVVLTVSGIPVEIK